MDGEEQFPSTRGQRTLAAIVMTDGVGFSARMSTDEERTLSLIRHDLELMQQLCQQFEGRVLKSTGDGLLMYFGSAVQAVTCAIAIQQQLTEVNQKTDEPLLHRIGIHLGDVFLSSSDVMGNGVNIAARLQAEAEPGGICISKTAYDVVKSRLTLDATYIGPLKLKNIQEAVPTYHIKPVASPGQSTQRFEDAQIAVGTVVGDRYQITRLIGRGGFGRTYLAIDTYRFEQPCVLKEFVPVNKSEYIVKKARDLFEREARVLYQIEHPQIPKFLAWFTERGRVFIVQEYINGKTYTQMLEERQQQGQAFSEAEVVQWLVDLLPVLDYLHRHNIVHRDISPDNIMLPVGRSQPMLIDFGLVKQIVHDMEAIGLNPQELSSQPSFVGKVGYAPVEQIRMGHCFPCSDLYALGVTALVLLTGKEPMLLMDQGSLEWNWQAHVNLSPALTKVLNKMLAEKPRERYQSAASTLADLLALPQDNISPLASPPAVLPPPASAMGDRTSSQGSAPIGSGSPSPELVKRCQQELARHIGPMAKLIIEEILSQSPGLNSQQLIEAIAAEIPDSQKAQAFRQQFQAFQ